MASWYTQLREIRQPLMREAAIRSDTFCVLEARPRNHPGNRQRNHPRNGPGEEPEESAPSAGDATRRKDRSGLHIDMIMHELVQKQMEKANNSNNPPIFQKEPERLEELMCVRPFSFPTFHTRSTFYKSAIVDVSSTCEHFDEQLCPGALPTTQLC